MAFSLRSFFGKEKPSGSHATGTVNGGLPTQPSNGATGSHAGQNANHAFAANPIYTQIAGAAGQPGAPPFSPFSPSVGNKTDNPAGETLAGAPHDPFKKAQPGWSGPASGGGSPFSATPPGGSSMLSFGTNGNSGSPFASASPEPPAGQSEEEPTALFHPSPFGFGSEAKAAVENAAAGPSPFSPIQRPPSGDETRPEPFLGGGGSPFAPPSAGTPSPVSFGMPQPPQMSGARETPNPFSFGAPVEVPPPAPATSGWASAFSPAPPEESKPPTTGSVPQPYPPQSAPFGFGGMTPPAAPAPESLYSTAFQPTPPPPAPAPNFGSPFGASGEPARAADSSPFGSPLGGPAMAPPAPTAPSWLQTPAPPAESPGPFASGSSLPAPAVPPSPFASPFGPSQPPPLPEAAPDHGPAPAPMPAFPGFSFSPPAAAPDHGHAAPTHAAWERPAETAPSPAIPQPMGTTLPPKRPFEDASFPPAPPAAAPQPGPGGVNPFERIQALLGKPEAPKSPAFQDGTLPPPPEPAPSPFGGFGKPSDFPTVPNGTFPAPYSQPSPPPPMDLARPAPPAVGGAPLFAPSSAPQAPWEPPAAPVSIPTQAPERVPLSLASVLKGCQPQEIGMSPDHIPSWVQVQIPLGLIRPQLSSGRITIKVTDVMASLEPDLRNLITPVRKDLTVDLPMNEVLMALPEGARPAEAPPSFASPLPATAPFSSSPLFSPAVMEKSTSPELVFGAPSPPSGPGLFQAAHAHSNPEPFEPAHPDGGDAKPVPGEPVPYTASAFSYLNEGLNASGLFSPPPLPPLSDDEDGVPSAKLSVSTRQPGVAKSAIRVASLSPSAREKSEPLMLRALLGTEEPLNAHVVVRQLSRLPGITAAVCLNDGVCLAAAGNGSAEAEHFMQQAPKMHHHVQPLIDLTGIQDTETFSMNSGRLVVTFSLKGEGTLGVLHDPQKQEPALREKITLIARGLSALLETPAAA